MKRSFLTAGVSLVLLLALYPAPAARTQKPDIQFVPFDDSFTFQCSQGFDVLVHVEGTQKLTIVDPNNDHRAVFTVQALGLHGSFTNIETGKSRSFINAEKDAFFEKDDGSGSVTVTGALMLTIPGSGIQKSPFAFAGREVITFASLDCNFDCIVSDEAHGLSVDSDNDALCAYLAN